MFVHLLILAGALAAEAAFGYPASVFRAVRHPVVWMGWLIAALDRRLNAPALPARQRRRNGIWAELILLLAVAVPAASLQALLARLGWPGLLALCVVGSSGLASRSLAQHVRAVADALDGAGLDAARRAVSHLVGRDPDTLDEAGVARAAIESLAENFSDGVVAPALWCALLGLPGLAAYKAINTADSMVGHRTPRHERYGWAAARLDDLVNLPASRLAAAWLVLAASVLPGCDAAGAWRALRRDARHHRSPNAGWPEAAMAGALGLRLAGPRVYGGTRVDDAWMGDGRAAATPADLRAALRLYRAACVAQGLAAGALLLVAAMFG